MDDLISREQAIDALREKLAEYVPYLYSKKVEEIPLECEMTIKKLPSAQPTHTAHSNTLDALDCISRQAAIDAMYGIVERNKNCMPFFDDELAENPYIDVIVDELENLPSAEPKQKTGKWVYNIHDIPICDRCGYMTHEYGNYCPHCGARMEVEE